jgi:formylglycine-generating enzyme required for sulfatase activity
VRYGGATRQTLAARLLISAGRWGVVEGDRKVEGTVPDDPRVRELLEELLATGGSPEAVCRSHPNLLPMVRERWQQVVRMRAELDAMFPPENNSSTGADTPPPEDGLLPDIQGYEVEGVLGAGGMGVVYRARHLRLDRLVALKMVLTGSYAGPQERERFRREAEAVAALRHPNLVQVYDAGDCAGRPYFTMELIEGGNLAEKLAGTPQPISQATALLATLAEAMQAAHRGGIVHRDLKPANILLTPDGTPKIADFGLALRLEGGAGLTLNGVVMGTPSYMAPEQARGQSQAVGPTVDVYALGAILYELLTGRPPFRAETPAETVLQVIDQEPVPPARLNSKVPRDLETVCLKCLQKEPARRYGSAGELANDLRRFQAGEPIRARPVGVAERTYKWARRRPAPAALLGVVLLALVSQTVLSVNLVVARNDAEEKRKTAEDKEAETRKEADKAETARDFLVHILRRAETDKMGRNVSVGQILNDAETEIPVRFADQPELRADLVTAIREVKRGIGRRTPQAMILEVRGTVQVRPAIGEPKAAVSQALLNLDDRLSLSADGKVQLVFLSDLHKEWVAPGREVTIDYRGCEPSDAVLERDASVLMTFVRLPKATFYMGWNGTPGSAERKDIEEDFEIAAHHVTQGQWEAIMGENPSHFSRQGSGRGNVLEVSDEELKLLPVENVSWDEVQEFIRKLNERERSSGYLYRLPTEKEWEYACRGGATSEEECSYLYYFDKPTNDLSSEQANFNGNFPGGDAPRGKILGRTTRVGAYPPNKLGICDMNGNVWHWCANLKNPNKNGSSERAWKGGSWNDLGPNCHAADRNGADPTHRGNDLGFRLVRVIR